MSNWQEVALGEVCSIEIGGTPSRSNESYWWKSEDDGIRLPWVSISDMKEKTIMDTKESITEAGASQSNCKHVPKGSLLMSFKLTIGRLAFAGRDLYTNEAISTIKPIKDILPEFLYYGLQYWNLTGDSDQAVKGVTLNKQKLQEIPCLLPPLPEQKKIAEILSGIDAITSSLQAKRHKLLCLFHSLLDASFPFQTQQETAIDELPIHDASGTLASKSLGEICAEIGDGIHATPEYSDDGDYYFVNGNNLSGGKISTSGNTKRVSASEKSKYKDKLAEDSVLMSINGTIGNIAFYEGEKVLLGKSACYLNPSPELDRHYLYNFLSAPSTQEYFRGELTGSTIKNLSLKTIRSTMIYLPSMSKQKEISLRIESVRRCIAENSAQASKAREIKCALADALLSGRKRVSI